VFCKFSAVPKFIPKNIPRIFRDADKKFTKAGFFSFSLPYFMQKINPFERNLGSSDFILRKKF